MNANGYRVYSAKLGTGQTIDGIIQNADGYVEGAHHPYDITGPRTVIRERRPRACHFCPLLTASECDLLIKIRERPGTLTHVSCAAKSTGSSNVVVTPIEERIRQGDEHTRRVLPDAEVWGAQRNCCRWDSFKRWI